MPVIDDTDLAQLREQLDRAEADANKFCAETVQMRAEIERLRAVLEPFLRFYDDIRFNLRKQPSPFDPAVAERGERNASLTWADFYNLRDAMRVSDEQ